MSEIFWETVQRARKSYFCDYCTNGIERGHLYQRKVWKPGGRDYLDVLRWHDEPSCPPNIGEEIAREMMREEREALGVPIVFVGEVRQVLRIGLSGETIVESETYFVPKLVCEAVDSEPDDLDEEIPF